MTEEIQRRRMPARLKTMLVVMYLQVFANGFGGIVLFDNVQTAQSHGARVPYAGALYTVAFASFLVAAVLLACAVLTPRRFAWIRPAVIAVEVVSVVSGLIGLAQGGPVTGVVGIALGISMIVMLNREEIRDWFSRVA
jgi:hypothetical protein